MNRFRDRFAAALGDMGVNGDSTVGHLTPGEIQIPPGVVTPKLMAALQEAFAAAGEPLEAFVAGSPVQQTNPTTGLPMFAGGIGSDPDRGGRHGGSGFGGRDRDDDRGGSDQNNEDRNRREAYQQYQSSRNAARTEPQYSGSMNDFMVEDYTGQVVDGSSGEVSSSQAPSLGEQALELATPIERAPYMTPAGSVQQGTYLDRGELVGGLASLAAPGLGTVAGAVLDGKLGYSSLNEGVSVSENDGLLESGQNNDGGLGGSLAAPSAIAAPSAPSAAPAFSRPSVGRPPAALGLSSQMTPLQLRSALATYAVSGDNSVYRSPAAAEYYDTLLQNALIGADGTLKGLDTLLPVELQYLQQTRGLGPPSNTRSLLEAIASA